MELSRIRPYTHKHCRFKLRSGKEVFGVIWEVETTDKNGQASEGRRLFFASIRDYERLQRAAQEPIQVWPVQPEEIVHVESIAS
jgi:hypothetical protein